MALSLAGCSKPAPLVAVVPPTAAQVTAVAVAKSYEAGDGDLATKVRAALLADAETKDLDIRVSSVRGDVKLSGLVDNPGQVVRALAVARAVPGVVTTEDELGLRR